MVIRANGNINKNLKVNLTPDVLRQSCYWIVSKFLLDKFHQQQNSSRSDLIGGFFDRWINRTPEFLIFQKLLENKSYDVVNDNFIYTQDSDKNAPDILGLEDKNGKYYPFALFNNGTWEKIPNSPFIEMKTFRESQKLITIPETQFFENHYYVIVESHIDESYLISLFDDEFFDEANYENIKKIDEFIKDDNKNNLKNPYYLKKNIDLGYYELLGIYTGKEINKFAITVGETNNKADKPRYLKKISLKEPFDFKESKILEEGLYYHNNIDENNVPCNVKIFNDSEIFILKAGKTFVDIKVCGEAQIDGILIKNDFYRLEFGKFDRSSKKREKVLSKDAIASSNLSSIDDLINEFDEFIKC